MAPFTTLASLLTLALVAGVQAQSASASVAQSSAPALGSSAPAQSSAVASATSAAASAAQPSASAGAGPDTSCDAHGCFKQIELSDGTPLELTQSVKYNTSGVNFTLACA